MMCKGSGIATYRDRYRVETTRLPSWDYTSPGYYFVTICTRGQQHTFGEIVGAEMILSDLGKAANECWIAIPAHFPLVTTDAFVVMPNHMHGIIIIRPEDQPSRENAFGSQSGNLGSIIRGYKIGVKKYATERGLPFQWQPRFYEHIIRSRESLTRIREYIATNPQRWALDEYNAARVGHPARS